MHWLDDEHRRYSIDVDEQEEAKHRENHRMNREKENA